MEIIETIALIGFLSFVSYLFWVDSSANAKLRAQIYKTLEQAQPTTEDGD